MVVASNLVAVEASPTVGNLPMLPSIPVGSSSSMASEDVSSSSPMGGTVSVRPAVEDGQSQLGDVG